LWFSRRSSFPNRKQTWRRKTTTTVVDIHKRKIENKEQFFRNYCRPWESLGISGNLWEYLGIPGNPWESLGISEFIVCQLRPERVGELFPFLLKDKNT